MTRRPDDAAAAPGTVPTEAVHRAGGDEGFLADLRQLYARVDAAVARGGAVCLGGGACCKFDLADHRLYVSTGELALLLRVRPPAPGRRAPGRCPYQVGPRCTARARRPLGCRTFFCRAGAAEQHAALYERHHRAIRRLHDRHGLPYAYVELTSAMAEVLASEKRAEEARGGAARAGGDAFLLDPADTHG